MRGEVFKGLGMVTMSIVADCREKIQMVVLNHGLSKRTVLTDVPEGA